MANILLVDIGNTAIKWALKDSSCSMEMLRQQYPVSISDDFFINCLADTEKVDAVFATCVAAPDIWQAFTGAVFSLWKIKVERVLSEAKGYGVINGYKNPSELGSDRWCALIAAHHMAKSDVVVISCGSAITIDVVNQSGEHLGGYILPGLTMMKKSLAEHTAQVKINADLPVNNLISPAHSTSECVEAGVNLAAVSVIDAVIKQQMKRSNQLQCICTGGDAETVTQHLSTECVTKPDLILHGLAIIAKNNRA